MVALESTVHSVALDSTVRLVMLQFSFSNPNAIPSMVRRLNGETQEDRALRKSHSNGIKVIEETRNCSLERFLEEIDRAGFEMVDAFCKERINTNERKGSSTYHMVRFMFARHEFAKPSGDFKVARDAIRIDLQSMCQSAMWRVRSFLNPFFTDGKEVRGQKALSINLEAREPLFQPNGQPVTVWQRGENGARIGGAPLPIKPAFCLRVVGEAVSIWPA